MADETTPTNPPAPASPAPASSTPASSAPAASPAPALTLGDAPAAPQTGAAPVRKAAEPKQGWWWGTGRRKTAVARVRIKPGAGDFKIQITGKKTKTIDEYFSEVRDRDDCVAPLKATSTLGKLDIVVRAAGGGYMGQAGAIRLGVSRALATYDPTLEHTLRDHGYLTRDAREVERKKYGQAGARRKFQFSKR